MNTTPPKYLPTFMDLLRKETERRGAVALVPFSFIVCGVLGSAAAWAVPEVFWADASWEVSAAVYGGLMTFGGLVLALGWTAFSRIYEVLFRGEFGAYLQSRQLLAPYLVHISTMHAFQVVAVVAAGVGLLTILLEEVPILGDRIILGATVTFTVYALKQALDAVAAMNDLVWQAAVFENDRSARQNGVVPFGERTGR